MAGCIRTSHIVENEYISRVSNSFTFIFVFILKGDQLLRERICSSRSKFFPFRVDSFLRGFSSKEAKQEVTKVFCS